MCPGTGCAKFTANFIHAPDTAQHENPKLAACPSEARFGHS